MSNAAPLSVAAAEELLKSSKVVGGDLSPVSSAPWYEKTRYPPPPFEIRKRSKCTGDASAPWWQPKPELFLYSNDPVADASAADDIHRRAHNNGPSFLSLY